MKFSTNLFVFIFLFSFVSLQAQDQFEDEMNKIAKMLTSQLNVKKKVNRVAVADFIYQGQKNTRIGKYMADQLNIAIMMNGATFNMVNREEVRQAMGAPKQPLQIDVAQIGNDVTTAVTGNEFKTKEVKTEDYLQAGFTTFTQLLGNSSKKLKADVIVYGAIMGQGDNLKVTIEASRNNRSKDNVAFAKGSLIKTPDVASLLQGTVAPPTSSSPVVSSAPSTTGSRSVILGGSSDVTPFKHNNLTFEIVNCQQDGRNIECTLNVVSSDVDADLWLYFQNTRIIDANGGHEFHVKEMKLADASSTNHRVGKSLISDVPIECVLRFTEVNRQITSIAKMQINCYHFTAQLNNVPVN